MTSHEGKYLYCIIDSDQERNFGPIGVGGRGDEVQTINYDSVNVVVSNHRVGKLKVDRKSLVNHEKVIERVMQEYHSVIPIRYGTVASSAGEVRDLLYSQYGEIKSLLTRMAYKIELGVKAVWQNMDVIFEELVKEYREVREAKEKFKRSGGRVGSRIEIGRLVEKSLLKKKEKEVEKIIESLESLMSDYKLNPTFGDEMFMNAAFLVDKNRESNFDKKMDQLNQKYKDRIKFKYIGPLPIFNFVDISIGFQNKEKSWR
jgi:hypothetical protein